MKSTMDMFDAPSRGSLLTYVCARVPLLSWVVALAFYFAGGICACAQNIKDMTIDFLTSDTTVCDASQVGLVFKFDNLVPFNGSLYLTYELAQTDGNASKGEERSYVCSYNDVKSGIWSPSSSTPTSFDPKVGHKEFRVSIKKAYVTTSTLEKDFVYFNIGPNHVQNWHVYATPLDNLEPNDPRRIAILNDNSYCGFDVTLRAKDNWSSFSTYEWKSSNELFTITSNGGSSAMLREVRFSEGQAASQPLSTTITLTQTVGGKCVASVEKVITMNGMPEGTIARADESGVPREVRICSSLAREDDVDRIFDGSISAFGVGPFTATLSTGDKFSGLKNGENMFSGAYTGVAGSVVLSKLVDANGCEASADRLHGYVAVHDRKPLPYFLQDTIVSESVELSVEVRASDIGHSFEWGVVPQHVKYDARVEGRANNAEIFSNMRGVVGYWVIETDESESVACPSDSSYLWVDYHSPLRYPNGFSPNGDGRNDKLVIEGLPSHNMLKVMDYRGKIVYDVTDYRNDWSAEGLPDGHYVYIFKGEGCSTVKESLIIKRTNND